MPNGNGGFAGEVAFVTGERTGSATLRALPVTCDVMGPGHQGCSGQRGRSVRTPKKFVVIGGLVLMSSLPGLVAAEEATVKIHLSINGNAMTATLTDNATAKDFLSLLPMTLTLEDYAATEKISYLSRKLSTAGAPAGSDPSVGDIAYYAPWGNLAIFYQDASYARGLIRLGRIDSGMEALNMPGPLKLTIEAVP